MIDWVLKLIRFLGLLFPLSSGKQTIDAKPRDEKPKNVDVSHSDNLWLSQLYYSATLEAGNAIKLGSGILATAVSFDIGIASVILAIITTFCKRQDDLSTLAGLPFSAKVIGLFLIFAAFVVTLLSEFALERSARRYVFARKQQESFINKIGCKEWPDAPDFTSINKSMNNTAAYAQYVLTFCGTLAFAGLLLWYRTAFHGLSLPQDPRDQKFMLIGLLGIILVMACQIIWYTKSHEYHLKLDRREPAKKDCTGTICVIYTISFMILWVVLYSSNIWLDTTRIEARIVKGMFLKISNHSSYTINILPPDWGRKWMAHKNQGPKLVNDVEGDYYKVAPKSEYTFCLGPTQKDDNKQILSEKFKKELFMESGPLNIQLRDGTIVQTIKYKDIRSKLIRAFKQ